MRDLQARYDIGPRIGGGAMADVYRARDRSSGLDVALKVLRPAFSEDPELVGRFQREADAIASIDHPNVVKVLDHGSADGSHYIAMELIEGPTLQQLIRERGRLSEEDARYLGEQIAAGLAAAHDRGVIHRDLKPANILVDAAGTAKVSDFGIAHLASMTQLTRTGEVLGTPRYIAPEQVAGKIDARTDLYALGLVLYELVTGAPAFDGETSFQIVRKQLREKPPSLRAAVPSVSRRFESIVTRALQKEPAKRFASAAAMRDALARPVAAPVTAIAARGRRAAAGSRSLGAVAASLLAILLLAGVAVARGVELPRAAAIASPGEHASASAPSVAPTTTPSPSEAATPAPTPEPTPPPTPVPTNAATAAPVIVPAATSGAAAQPSDPAAAVASFYDLVTAKRYADAAALWSPRMQAAYPPSTNIWGRFDSTRSIRLVSSSVAARSATAATVNVDITEIFNDGTVRRYAGQWYLVRSGSGWLMDQPALHPA